MSESLDEVEGGAPTIPTATAARLDELLAASPVVIYATDAVTWRANFISANCRDLIGRDACELLADSGWWERSLHPDDSAWLVPKVTAWIAEGARDNLYLHYRLRRADGIWLWTEDHLRAVRDSDGNIIEFVGAIADISARKEDERRLAELRQDAEQARATLMAAINVLPDGFALFDAEDRLVLCNEQYREVYPNSAQAIRPGVRFEELLRFGMARGEYADAVGREEAWLAERLAAHRRAESVVEQRLRDGRWMRVFERATPEGGRVGLRVDITELKRQEQRLSDIIAGTNVGTWEWNVQTGQTIFNERWASILGYTLEELGETTIDTWERLCHPEDLPRSLAALDAHFRGETDFYVCELRMLHRDGHVIWVHDHGRVSSWLPDGRPAWMSGTHQEITERKTLQQQLSDERDFLARIMATSVSAIIVLDGEGRIIFANGEAETLLGLSRREIEMRRFDAPAWQICAVDGGPFAVENLPFVRVMASGAPVKDVRHGIILPDGRRRILSINAAPLPHGSANGGRVVCSVMDITERIESDDLIRRQAREDSLTLLVNRATLMEDLSRLVGSRRRGQRRGALVLLDLDYFKDINDTLGHVAGDHLLREIAARLRAAVRGSDTVARLGGDEFAIILRDLHKPEDIATVLDALLASIRRPLRLAGREIVPSMSLGVAVQTGEEAGMDELYRNADTALYHAKASGRDTWKLFDGELSARIARRQEIARALVEIVSHDRLDIAFQPKVNLRTGEHAGFEALLHWRKDGRLLPAAEIAAVAEETGSARVLDERMLARSVELLSKLIARGHDPGHVAVNVSTAQLKDPDFIPRLSALLRGHGLSPHRLELEITENILLDRASGAMREALEKAAAIGVFIAVDNFGTGYASLSHLTQFPAHRLKIDRSFVAAIDGRGDQARIPATIIGLAHNLDLSVIADGVETQAQFDTLALARCDFAQGDLISPPIAEYDALARFVAARARLKGGEEVFLI